MRRASSTGDESSPTVSRISAASRSHSGCSSSRCTVATASSEALELLDPVDEREAQHLRRVEQERVAAATVDGLRQLGEGAFEHTGRLEEPPGPGVPVDQDREQLLGRVGAPAQRRVAPLADPVEQSRAGPRAAAMSSAASSERSRAYCAGGSAARSTTPSSTAQPSTLGPRFVPVGTRCGPLRRCVQPPAQERRRHQGGHEHHEQQRRVEVVAEDALVEADGGEDQPDLAAGDHAEADEPLVAGRPERADRGDELADDRHHEERTGDPAAPRDLANFSTSTSMPIPRKNTGMKRWPTGASSRWMRSARRLPESARPATNAPTIGASFAASASSANASVNASASATSVPADCAYRSRNWKNPGANFEPSARGQHEEPDRHRRRSAHDCRRSRPCPRRRSARRR